MRERSALMGTNAQRIYGWVPQALTAALVLRTRLASSNDEAIA